MKWTVLTLVILITTSFGEEAGTNRASGDPRESNEFLANYVQIEKTLHTCAVPSKNMFERRTGQDGQPQSSAFDMFCYYQASKNPLSLFLCQYYQLLVENYYGKYCGDPNRLPMDTATQYTQMLQTPSAPCQTLVVTVMQEVQRGVNKPVFSSTDDCETVCHGSLFCTNLAYLMSIFQSNTSGGGGEAPADTGGSPSGDGENKGENNGEIPEGGKDSEAENPPEGVVPGGGGGGEGEREGEGERKGEGEEGNDIPGEVTDDKKSSEQLGGDKINGGDEGDNDGANIKDGDEYNKLHIPQMDNHEDDSHGLPPPADLSPPQDGVPGEDSGGVLPFDEDNAGTPAEDHQEDEGTEENVEKKEGEGERGSSFQSTTPVGKSTTSAGNFSTFDFGNKDGQLPFDAESLSSESDAGDMESLDESSDDKASKEEFFEDVLKNAGELDGQENGDGNEPLLPNAENQQENSKNQNSFKDEMNRLEEEEASSHFLAYSLTAIILIMVTYILYHNKQKIVAIIIEGRNAPNGKRRRYNQNVYTTVNEMA